MRSIVTVTAAATDNALTTLARVKSELSITVSTFDTILQAKIDEASSDCQASLGFNVAKESITETFWHQPNEQPIDCLILDRTPVVSIASVVADGQTVDPTHYRLDPDTGELFALDPSGTGYPSVWMFFKSLVVTYSGGYVLPPETNRTLPKGIEGACIYLVQCYWFWKNRDPSVKSEEAPGIMRYDYWVGSIGEAGELPPGVVMRLAPYRRAIA